MNEIRISSLKLEAEYCVRFWKLSCYILMKDKRSTKSALSWSRASYILLESMIDLSTELMAKSSSMQLKLAKFCF